MRLSPPIAVLTLIAAVLVWMGVSRAGGECELADDEQVSLLKSFKWAGAAMSKGGKPTCDILTFGPTGGATEEITLPMLRFRYGGALDFGLTTVINDVVMLPQGATKVSRQLILQDLESHKNVVSPIEVISERQDIIAGEHAFGQISEILAPLRTAAVKSLWISNFIGPDLEPIRQENVGDEPVDPLHVCLATATDTPGATVGFRQTKGSEYLDFSTTPFCVDRYSSAARERIYRATEIALNAAHFYPPEPVFVQP